MQQGPLLCPSWKAQAVCEPWVVSRQFSAAAARDIHGLYIPVPEPLRVCRAWHGESCDSSEGGDSGAKDSPSSCCLCGLHLTVWMETAGRCFKQVSILSALQRCVG